LGCTQVDQLLKETELLRNESELARAEHANQLLDVQAAAHRSKAAAEQREAALQVLHLRTVSACVPVLSQAQAAFPMVFRVPIIRGTCTECLLQCKVVMASIGGNHHPSLLALQSEKATAEQHHRAVAGHLQETVASLETKLQAQKDLTDSHLESHAHEVADLKAQIELAQVGLGRRSDRCVHHEHSARWVVPQCWVCALPASQSLGGACCHMQACQHHADTFIGAGHKREHVVLLLSGAQLQAWHAAWTAVDDMCAGYGGCDGGGDGGFAARGGCDAWSIVNSESQHGHDIC
jgi:hypothetical protein